MNKEKILLIVTFAICMAGCFVISVTNLIEANYHYAVIIPAPDYASSIIPGENSDTGKEASSIGSAENTVNINTATAEKLAEVLPGIGIVKARRIVEYRELIGGFESVDQLLNIDGIGDKTLEKIRPYCRLKD